MSWRKEGLADLMRQGFMKSAFRDGMKRPKRPRPKKRKGSAVDEAIAKMKAAGVL